MVASTKGKKLSLLKGKKPRETDYSVILDHDPVEAYAAARREQLSAETNYLASRRRRDPQSLLDELQEKLDEAKATSESLESAAEEAVVTLRLRAMLPLPFAALKAEFPATDVDHKRLRELTGDDKAKAQWNRDEFQPRLVAHSIVGTVDNGVLTVEEADVDEAREYMDTWAETEWNMLVSACLRVNQETVDTNALGFSSARTRN